MGQQLNLPIGGHTSCKEASCGELLHQSEIYVGCFRPSEFITEQHHFCNPSCWATWYVGKLRQIGM